MITIPLETWRRLFASGPLCLLLWCFPIQTQPALTQCQLSHWNKVLYMTPGQQKWDWIHISNIMTVTVPNSHSSLISENKATGWESNSNRQTCRLFLQLHRAKFLRELNKPPAEQGIIFSQKEIFVMAASNIKISLNLWSVINWKHWTK